MRQLPFITRLVRDECGTSAVEYGMICAMIILAMLSGLSAFGNMTRQTWGTISTQTANAVAGATGS